MPQALTFAILTIGIGAVYAQSIAEWLISNGLVKSDTSAMSVFVAFSGLVLLWGAVGLIPLAYVSVGPYPTAKQHQKIAELQAFYDKMKAS